MHIGLSDDEVEIRRKAGLSNNISTNVTKISDIFKKHILTVFNIVNLTLAFLVFFFGEKRDAIFILVAISATTIAITNDLRARNEIKKLSIISEKPTKVIRNGVEKKISAKEIVKDDIIKFESGDQVVVDSILLEGEIEVNEAFITGESNNVHKTTSNKILSGSFVIAGECLAQATAVGNKNSLIKIIKNAKKIKDERSQLFNTLNKIIKFNSIALIPIGLLLFFKQLSLEDATIESSITSTASGVVAMIPEGLILLTSSILALAAINLTKRQVIVSDFYSIETLARTDTICFDKTGTLTSGKMKVEKIISHSKKDQRELEEYVKVLNSVLKSHNQTSKALIKKFGQRANKKPEKIYEFSSERKFSGYEVNNMKFLLGAYDYVTKNQQFKLEEEKYSKKFRVLTAIKIQEKKETILGFILLSDEIRKDAKSLIDFFKNNSVKCKIISGDSPKTIQYILSSINLNNLKMCELPNNKTKNLDKIVEDFDVFARATPEDKQNIIKELRNRGHTVTMIGDGVNDILAMKEADCGISISDGADAARRTAEIVLLKNDLNKIKDAIFEGRQAINNLTRSSALFLSKTIYASVLSIIFIFINLRYPFSPIEMSFINCICIGIPSFLLALETNHSPIKNNFKTHIIQNSLPAAIATISAIITVSFLAKARNLSWGETIFTSCILTSTIGLSLVYKISKPFNKFKKILLSLLFLILSITLITNIGKTFFLFKTPTIETMFWIIAISCLSEVIFLLSSRFLSRQSAS